MTTPIGSSDNTPAQPELLTSSERFIARDADTGSGPAGPGVPPWDENVRLAGFWVRLAATLVDLLFFFPLAMVLGMLVYMGSSYSMSNPAPEFSFLWLADNAVSFGVPALVTVLFWRRMQATPGKLALGLRVVDANTGQTASMAQSVIRYLGYFASATLLGIGYLWCVFDKRKQCWQDKMAQTLVVYEDTLPPHLRKR